MTNKNGYSAFTTQSVIIISANVVANPI